MDRKMVSCFKGLAPVSFPSDWLKGFDMNNSWACVNGEARIRFPSGRAFGISIEKDGVDVIRHARELTQEEIITTPWGKFCEPWETYSTAKLFGHGETIKLDEI